MAKLLVVAVASLLFGVGSTLIGTTGDSCDWIGSGLEHPNEEHGVQPVYLRCSQGTIQWRWPRGALRIVLRLGSAGRDFRGCLRAKSPAWQEGRVYLEGDRKLHLLFAPQDGKPVKLARCFTSVHGQAALYVEADALSMRRDARAAFTYDLKPLRLSNDVLEECRPCSDDELLTNFCVSDFVATGVIASVKDVAELGHSAINVKVDRVIREALVPIFWTSKDKVQSKRSTLHVPLKCQVRSGPGDFIFMGRMMLGEPFLRCAPRLHDWNRLKEEATRTGRSQCNLE